MGNFYEVDELLNEAIMTGVPSVIVEGIDDIALYSKIFERVCFDVEIYPVETIEGYGEGCEQVLNAIKDLNEIESTRHLLSSNMLGVIDKDVRDFRDEIPEIEPVLVLNHYSIESHFVSKNIIGSCLRQLSKINTELVTEQLCSQIIEDIEEKLVDLYYFSLESLKGATDPNYQSDFSYSQPWGRMKDDVKKSQIFQKREGLDSYATGLNLEPSLDVLKSISKGKWLIEAFSDELLKSLRGLHKLCEEERLQSCAACITSAHEKCLYRLREGVTRNSVKHVAFSDVSSDEFSYIVERVSSMKPSPQS